MSRDDISFHSQRAQAELELAKRATRAEAARAHIGLYALHVERLSMLTGQTVTAIHN
jgi:hypothetical protein